MKCWFCKEEKEADYTNSKISLAYGYPFPMITLTVEGGICIDEGKLVYHLCKECKNAILRTIADSKVTSKNNVLAHMD